jgi:4-hydroxymandelate oxidase
MSHPTPHHRREFLKFLAASPYVAAFGGVAAFLPQTFSAKNAEEVPDVIANPASALDIFDLEAAAHRKVLPGHWAYAASGVDDNATLLANREGFKHV